MLQLPPLPAVLAPRVGVGQPVLCSPALIGLSSGVPGTSAQTPALRASGQRGFRLKIREP